MMRDDAATNHPSPREGLDMFVPDDFTVPEAAESPAFTLRPIGINDAVKDYDAVMTSRERLRGVFGPTSTWPGEDLSLEQNIVDLAWHQKEFQRRTSFAFAVMSSDKLAELGCVYLYPSSHPDFDVEAYLWVRADSAHLDEELYGFVRDWLVAAWPFRNPAFPGRTVPWDAWTAPD